MAKRVKVPKDLPADAKKIFRQVVKDIEEKKDVNTINSGLIENFAYMKYLADRAKKNLIDQELAVKDKAHGGMLKKNPNFQIYKDSLKSMLDIAKAINPDDKTGDDLKDDPMMKLLKDSKR